jgi:hypothetical protein
MSIYEQYKQIKSKKDFEIFLKLLVQDLKENKQDWDNDSLELFLEALYGYNFESENEEPSWKKFAEMLLAAKVYE